MEPKEVDWSFKVDHLKNFSTFDCEANGKNPGKV